MERKKCIEVGCESLRWARKRCREHDAFYNPDKYRIKPKPVVSLQKKREPISQISDKRKRKNQLYSVAKSLFIKDNPNCQISLKGCTIEATDIHHLYSGRNREKYFLDTTTWKSACRNCHDYVHNKMSSEEAISLNLKKTE